MDKVSALTVRVGLRWWVGAYMAWLGALQSVGYPINVGRAAERISKHGVRILPCAHD